MKPITLNECSIKLIVMPEWEVDPEDCFDDVDTVRQVKQDRQSSLWAWCTTKVSVEWNGAVGESNWLGCCSYENEDEFKNDLYYKEMLQRALKDLNTKVAKLQRSER